ncbi:MAG: tyrosine-type recombinase/integrase [Rubrivivax sp.]|nr:tyrosine-type recombinase/integrase [Rubrivivax sp.]
MARPKKDQAPDLAQACDLTAGAIERLTCPPGKPQAFLRDTKAPSLRVRVTAAGAKAYVFEAKLNRRNIRRTIGDVRDWAIEAARAEARRLAVLIDEGTDPRELERQQAEAAERLKAEAHAQAEAATVAQTAQALTVGTAWATYIAERRPHWGERNYADHLSMTHAGGEARKRMPGVLTKPGPLAPLMTMRLVDLDGPAVEAWAQTEAKDRPARVRLALRLLRAFLRWAGDRPDLKDRVTVTATSKKARESAGKARAKDDVLEKGQLATWFERVRALQNPVISAYLQVLLLTGARPGEVLSLRWDDIDAQWGGIVIRDKVEGTRRIPLTPYIRHLLAGLPHRNQWVFSSTRAISLDPRHVARRERYHDARGQAAPAGDMAQSSESGRLVEPGAVHRQLCAAAGLEGLSLHGLRRSFASLTEWLEVPAGVVAQLMGHKPSATAEKHYKVRPLDLLRVHHERIEAWILKEAGIPFDPATEVPGLRVVAG